MRATAEQKRLRSQRFQTKTLEVPMPAVRVAFAEVIFFACPPVTWVWVLTGRGGIQAGANGRWVSNSDEALSKLVARKLQRGEVREQLIWIPSAA